MAGKAVVKDDSASDGSRTGDKDKDYLHFYLTSSHYDCTFSASVSKEGSCAKIFKCHRFVLAAASTVFEKMLFGNFKEANQGPDDEIKLEVSPTAFDLAMRYIYGNQSDFQSCELAVEIYYFAHKWMIEGLRLAAGKFLMKYNGADDALLVYEMCIDLNIAPTSQLTTRFCMIIQKKTNQVLSSKQWLAAGRETILSIYSMPHLTVSEAYLLEKLVLWGKARCSIDQSTDLRAEIDPMLKNIRFRSMSCKEFSAISNEGDVLTAEEKFKIMESLSLSNANLMPSEFSRLGYPRNLNSTQKFPLGTVEKHEISLVDLWSSVFYDKFKLCSFYVDKGEIFLKGIYLISGTSNKDISFSYTIIRDDTYTNLGTAKFDDGEPDKQKCLLFNEPIALARGILHHIMLNYNTSQVGKGRLIYIARSKPPSYFDCPGYCTIFFQPGADIFDVCGFQLLKC